MSDIIKIRIRQKEAINTTIANIGKEIFDMYQLTIWKWVSVELQLFVVYFFLKIKSKDKSLLCIIFENNINKLLKFDKVLSENTGYLSKGDYTELKIKYNVENILKYDIIFLLMECILNRNDMEVIAKSFFSEEDILEINNITKLYWKQIESFLLSFKEKRIKDDRYNENWKYVDLSKSIHRPVYMRLSKTLSIPLQRNANFMQLTKNSPLTLEFIQNIDINLILDLWKYLNVFDYINNLDLETKEFLKQTSSFILQHISFDINISDIIAWLVGYYIAANKSKKERQDNLNKIEQLQRMLTKHNKEYKKLSEIVKKSIWKTGETTKTRTIQLEAKIEAYKSLTLTKEIKKEIKRLERELEKMKNLEFEILENQ